MADEKTTELTALTTPSDDDLLVIVDDPAGTPVTKKITKGNLFAPLLRFSADIIRQVNGSTGQILQIYKSRTDESTYSRLEIDANSVAGTVVLNFNNPGSSLVGQIRFNGSSGYNLNANDFTPNGDGSRDLGTSSSKWEDVYCYYVHANNYLEVGGAIRIKQFSSGDMALMNAAENGFTVLRLGPSGTSPTFRLNGVNLNLINGDQNAYCSLKAKTHDVDATITAAGTTGAQTINKGAGTVNFAAGASSLVVTNSLVTTSSIVMAVVRTNDSTAAIKNVVPASGSFTINLTAAATAETSVGFIVTNP